MSDTLFSVLFFGTPEFAVPSLVRLVSDNTVTVAGVVTQPDKPKGSTLR